MRHEIHKNFIGIKTKVIMDYVSRCDSCSHHLPLKSCDPIKNITAKAPWERIQIDMVDLRKYSELNNGFG